MKKLMAILMALVMCCSLVVSASAESIDTDYFYIDVDLEGTWTETSDWEAEFNTEIASLYVYVADESEVGDLEDYYFTQMADAEDAYLDDPETFYFEEGEIDDCPAFCLDYYEGNVTGTVILILTDNYIYEITIGATDEEYYDLWAAATNMTVYDFYTGNYSYEEDEVIIEEEEEEIIDEEEEIIEEEEEEEIVEEEEEEDEKKPSDKDDEDSEEDDDKKSDKDDDEDEDEDEEKDNTTLIIIIVAGVAVVAIAAVVIVLVTKKKK